MPVGPLAQPGASARLPDVPTSPAAAATAGTVNGTAGPVSITFTASTNPGKPSGNYVATSSPGSVTASASSSPITFAAGTLTAGQAYTFSTVKQSGSGITSVAATTGSVTPYTVPGTPTSFSASRNGSQSVAISWTAPANNGGSAITNYEYSSDDGATYKSLGTTGTSATVTTVSGSSSNLANGTTYTFRVRAINAAGAGVQSSSSAATPYTTPSAPTSFSASRNGSQSIGLSWVAPSNGGSAITNYEYSSDNGATYKSLGTTGTSATVTTVSGSSTALANGTSYNFRVRAVNAAGSGAESATSAATPYTTPSITINSVNNVNESRATFNATLDGTGGAATTVTFEIKQSSQGDGSYQSFASTDGGSSTYYRNHTGLSVGTGYTVRAKATNAAGSTYSGTTTFTTWSLKNAYSTSSTGSFNIPTITPTGGSALSVSIYNIALVGGGGGGGFGSGGGGGQLKSYASAAVNAAGNNISWTIGGAGGPVFADDPGDRATSGGTTSISGTASTLSAPGGGGGLSDYPGVGSRSYDGGSSADNVNIWLGGTGTYGDGGKSGFVVCAGGGAGAGGHGGSGSQNVQGGDGGAAASIYGLSSVGGGGDGFNNSGGGNGDTNHSSSMRGRGGSGGDPNSILYPYESVPAVGGAISFDYYGQ